MNFFESKSHLSIGFILFLTISLYHGCENSQKSSNANQTVASNNSNVSSPPVTAKDGVEEKPVGESIFGITTDTLPYEDKDFSKLTDGIDAIKLPDGRRPLVRINIDPDDRTDFDHYETRVRGLKQHADVMVNLIDSHDMYSYRSVEEYSGIVRAYLERLGGVVDVWEIGNEVNGEWVGWKTDDGGNVIMDDGRKIPIREMDDSLMQLKRELVARQIAGAYQEIRNYETSHNKDLKIALTLFYNDDGTGDPKGHCWEKPQYEMFDWANNYIKEPVKGDLDYVLLSFYEEKKDCPILKNSPDVNIQTWVRIFNKLAGAFRSDNPEKGKVGFGEFGPRCYNCEKKRDCRECKIAKLDFIPRYYTTYHQAIVKAKVPRYIGGFFYWYFYQDMVKYRDKDATAMLESVAKSY